MNTTTNNNLKYEQHPFHLVDPSPWPFFTAAAIFQLVTGLVIWFHSYQGSKLDLINLICGFLFLLLCLYGWFSDVVTEATYEGYHTLAVQQNIRSGMVLFILSEVMFFFSFFWAFFYSSIAPTVALGYIWPPQGIEVLNLWELPIVNTLILLSSGVSVTWAHRAIISGSRNQTLWGLIITIALGVWFTACQWNEYLYASFSINDGIYGSTFYLTTGFHGFHVLVGTIFLAVCLYRHINYHFTIEHHFGFEAAAWYWHFVDVVWLFLVIAIYWWGA